MLPKKTAGPLPWLLVLCMAWPCTFLGCGREGPERVIVSGTVRYRGQPLERARILLRPVDAGRSETAGGVIVGGQYELSAKGGVPVGEYKVEIVPDTANVDATPPPGQPVPPPPMQIPAKYNRKTELSLSVPAGRGKLTKDFDLTD